MDYDHVGRLIRTYHKLDGQTEVLLVSNEYNELGQLVDKKLHSADGTNFKQSVDHRYNIRGWLTSINNSSLSIDAANNDETTDLYGMELAYDQLFTGVTTAADAQYNGNISAIKWSANLGIASEKERAYKFAYDGMNRLKSATYNSRTAGAWAANGAFDENNFTYDLNGNIKSLSRKSFDFDVTHAAFTMDNLTYDYGTGNTTSNKLLKVSDSGDKTKGFVEPASTTGNDYIYDANGNMTSDQNKGITAITYNHLNLPVQVNKGASDYIVYTYDAGGRKLAQQVFGSTPKVTDYMGEYIYENTALQFINTEEGRIVMTGASPEYQYHLKDHLGNVRTTFTTVITPEVNTATYETGNQVTELSQFVRMDKARLVNAAIFDHTNGTSSGYSERLNGSANEKFGVARSIAVSSGDVISAEIFVKYVDTNSANWTAALSSLLGQIAASTAGVVVDGANYSSSTSSFPYSGALPHTPNGTAPKAYLNWLVFDKNRLLDLSKSGYMQITTASKETGTDVPHERLFSPSISITEPGYVYIYLSNEETGTPIEVYFDDLKVTQVKTPIVQVEDYYPFGLTFNSYQRENSVKNKWKFQGQEHVDDLGLNWDSFKWRNHQPEIGRFFNVDPLSDKYVYNSPYAFSENQVVAYRELEGLEKVTIKATEFIANEKGKTVNTGGQLYTDKNVYNKNFAEAPNGGDYKQIKAGVETSNGQILSKDRTEVGDNFFEELTQMFTGDMDYFSESLSGEDTKGGSRLTGSIEDATFAVDINVDKDVMTFKTQMAGGDENKAYSIKMGNGAGMFSFTIGSLKSGREKGTSNTSTMSVKFSVDNNGNASFTDLPALNEEDKKKSTSNGKN
jgi:RHS repeat-associated protein